MRRTTLTLLGGQRIWRRLNSRHQDPPTLLIRGGFVLGQDFSSEDFQGGAPAALYFILSNT